MITVIASVIWGAAPASATSGVSNDSTAERRSASLVNDERQQRGKSQLRWSDALANIARDHSREMAREGRLFHDESLPDKVGSFSALAENVGVAGSADEIHANLMDSESHRVNILGRFVEIGVGVAVDDDGLRWLTQVFRTPDAQTRRTPSTVQPRLIARTVAVHPSSPHRSTRRASTTRSTDRGTKARASEVSRSVSILERITDPEEEGSRGTAPATRPWGSGRYRSA